ncbi:MAG: hypothetical protein HQL96_06435 [Magnetococcales bacterium]|nr:hypothetical protein [Magnetococcales bacterium]
MKILLPSRDGADPLPGSGARVVLFTPDPERDMEELLAMLDLLAEFAVPAPVIVTATPHPTVAWHQNMRSHGGMPHWIPRMPAKTHHILAGEECLQLQNEPCPCLHTLSERQTTASVCRALGDRLVLASHHLRQWCLTDPEHCPRRPPHVETRQ